MGSKNKPSCKSSRSGRLPPIAIVAFSDLATFMYFSIFSLCSTEITGPISVSGLKPSPNLIFLILSINACSNWFLILLSTKILAPAEQTCPAWKKPPLSA